MWAYFCRKICYNDIIINWKKRTEMAFKMPTGKELDKMLDQLSEKDKQEIRQEFEEDVRKEDKMRKRGKDAD